MVTTPRILLDSHVFTWFVIGDRRLSGKARDAIEEAADAYVSAVTAWEMSTKLRIGKWPEVEAIVARMPEVIERLQMRPLPITLEHGRLAGALPSRHKDPFDRLLAAQAQIEGLVLITVDPAFASLGTPTLW